MTEQQKQTLKSFEKIIRNYVEHLISPINSQIQDMVNFYKSLGHEVNGSCGGCIHAVIVTLHDYAKTNNLW